MIYITPTTKFLPKEASAHNEVMICDHIPQINDIRHNEKNGWHKNTIIDLFDSVGIDYKDKIFYTDSYLLFDDFPKFVIVNDNHISKIAIQFLPLTNRTLSFNPIHYNFLFLSNKPRSHRILCSMIIANLFSNVFYSYCPAPCTNNEMLFTELLLNTNYKFDFGKLLEPKWLLTPNENNKEEIYGGKGNTRESIQFLLSMVLTFNVTTSIIAESSFFEKGCMLTEKTLMAVYAGHFMIWPGAWKLAEAAKRIGLDVFDDYIDHSYQYLEHPGERVAEAFLRNKTFLDSIELQQEARDKCKNRLQANLDLIRDIPQLTANILALSTYKR